MHYCRFNYCKYLYLQLCQVVRYVILYNFESFMDHFFRDRINISAYIVNQSEQVRSNIFLKMNAVTVAARDIIC